MHDSTTSAALAPHGWVLSATFALQYAFGAAALLRVTNQVAVTPSHMASDAARLSSSSEALVWTIVAYVVLATSVLQLILVMRHPSSSSPPSLLAKCASVVRDQWIFATIHTTSAVVQAGVWTAATVLVAKQHPTTTVWISPHHALTITAMYAILHTAVYVGSMSVYDKGKDARVHRRRS